MKALAVIVVLAAVIVGAPIVVALVLHGLACLIERWIDG
jgi:hypothetical protein